MFGLAVNELLVISMLVGFIALLFLGVPVVWSLAGTSLVIAILALGLTNILVPTPISSTAGGITR